ncbi:MAG: phosphatidate cytidylyltransferase [Alphaproteobacteria bacterium]|nr:phosphatidate cytidylyltransferase [Alphaproteobacteria bacterium]
MFVIKSKSLKTELYRKAVHLSSLWMPMLILLCPQNFCIILFFSLLAFNLLAEYSAYRKTAVVGTLFRKMFIKTLRHKEVNANVFVPSGSVYILAAALFVSVCFSAKAAAAAMCIVLIADSNAALVGKLWGKFRFSNGKSVEGTTAFFISAVFVCLFFFPLISPVMIYVTAVLATSAEFFEKKIGIDDNLSIPLVSGFVLNLIV